MRLLLPFVLMWAVVFHAESALGQETAQATKVANELVNLINTGDHAGIQSKFNKEMSAALPPEKASEFFRGLTQQMGRIQTLGEPQPVGEALVFPVKCEKGMRDMQ